MIGRLDNSLYSEEIQYVSSLELPWENLNGRSVLITGATGMIGTFLIDVLMHRNRLYSAGIKIFAHGRNIEKLHERFEKYENDSHMYLIVGTDINCINMDSLRPDFIFHMASPTHPIAYATEPIETITANILWLHYLLEKMVDCGTKRLVFPSSVEIYGEAREENAVFDEKYCGYIDCNTLRAGYPEAKRLGESLCQAFIHQKNVDIVIPRLSRIYSGGTLLPNDSKALSQFLKKGAAGENIILKSEGKQRYSYCYLADAVAGLLYVLLLGKCGEAYNITDADSIISLKNLAEMIAFKSNSKVIYELPDTVESGGYSKATRAIMSDDKLKKLGWTAKYHMNDGIGRALCMMGEN